MDTQHLFPLPPLSDVLSRVKADLGDTPVVGLHAGAQCGKDQVSAVFQQHGFLYSAFSTRGKAAAQQVFGLTDEQTWSDEAKEIVIPHLGMTPREIFQRFLTEVCRGGISEDLWIRRALTDAADTIRHSRAGPAPYAGVLFQDVRIELEADVVRALGGEILSLQRHIPDSDAVDTSSWHHTDRSHSSEAGIAIRPHEQVLVNNGTLGDLRDKTESYISLRGLDGGSGAITAPHFSAPGM